MLAVYSLGFFIVVLLLSIPVAFALGYAALLPGWLGAPTNPGQVVRSVVTALDSFPLLAVPLFILAGEIMTQGGLARRLFSFADAVFGRFRGGLAMSTVAACMLFGAISGSSPATVAAIGSMAVPLLVARGYDLRFATALVTAAGTLGVIVPPSIPMIIYGMSAQVSVSALFIGGIGPALVIGALLMLYAHFYGRKHAARITSDAGTVSAAKAFRQSFWALVAPVFVLGGIYAGAFTPTEAAAIACVYGGFVAMVIFRELSPSDLGRVLVNTGLTIAPILIIAGTGAALGRVLTLLQVPAAIGEFIGGAIDERIILLLLINVILLGVGMVMETLSAIIVLTPILLPVLAPYGVDPVHFGLIMVVNLAIGFATPPVGVNIYVASGITKLSVIQICRGLVIPIALLIIGLLVVTYWPGLTLWLPSLAG
ncbi:MULTISPECIES: TRAP transporter large permease [Roseobacteraceae]|uniref:TRAP transporter large permease protein n=1 Tax=Alloyangia pacifica TaxID=311180 RepID=A0A2U8HLE5_9RHOB|nr:MULTISPECIES: TRAP transporter large permease [Roseobacteraceae]NDW56792.1 TRAP transporter large permease [Salipiger sp. PrR004]AWI85926.1 C4-dicarboxylate ABC transporter permease [Alloyangia pacifica]NDV52250.1 TRAP transporter large permease [Salipiger sp. PrR003]NDW00199.1 TRAP transporter large permease [Salipiger sp. PrR002]NDW31872.1 TRAP transporter large permease [Salipiger sp. PrR007]